MSTHNYYKLVSTPGPMAEIVIRPNSSTEIPGCETFVASCTAIFVSEEDIMFTRNGVRLTNDMFTTINVTQIVSDNNTFTVATLQICSVTQNINGMYECVVSNAFSNDSATFNVSVINEEGTTRVPKYI